MYLFRRSRRETEKTPKAEAVEAKRGVAPSLDVEKMLVLLRVTTYKSINPFINDIYI